MCGLQLTYELIGCTVVKDPPCCHYGFDIALLYKGVIEKQIYNLDVQLDITLIPKILYN